MSQLILNFFKKNEEIGLTLQPVGHCNYEDHIEVKGKKAYDLLVLSNDRKKNLNTYCKSIKSLLRNHQDIKPIENTKPMTFCWSLGNHQFLSTSLFYEYYMATMANTLSKLKIAMDSDGENNEIYKECKEQLMHLSGMFNEWKTQKLILPHVPYVVTPLFIKSMLCFIHGCHTLQVAHKVKDNNKPFAYATAMKSFGEVWPRHAYGEIATQQYLVSRILLYNELMKSEGDSGAKLTCAQEVNKLLPHTQIQKCFLNKPSLEQFDKLEQSIENTIADLINTDYAVAKSINDIQIPKTPKLIICPNTQQFGCKCK